VVVPNSPLNSIGFNFNNGLGIPYPKITIAWDQKNNYISKLL
jgi:hypothetical protein